MGCVMSAYHVKIGPIIVMIRRLVDQRDTTRNPRLVKRVRMRHLFHALYDFKS